MCDSLLRWSEWTTAEKNKVKAEKAASNAEKQLEESSATADQLRSEFKELEEQAFKVMEKYNFYYFL